MSAVPVASSLPTAVATHRVDFVDTARAIGILLVIVGHLPGLPRWLDAVIFSMHVPLFFWISGWLLEPARLAAPFGSATALAARRLVVPYVFFFVVSWLWWMATRDIGSRAEDFLGVAWSDPWVGFVSGIGPQIVVNPTLWFFPCLFATTLAFHLLARLAARAGAGPATTGTAVAAFAGALLLTMPATPARWPWGTDILPAALAMFACGQVARAAWPRLSRAFGAPGAVAALAWGLGLLAWVGGAIRLPDRVDLQQLAFGGDRLAFVAVALAGIAVVVRLSHRLPAGRVTRWLSTHTLILFPTHVLIFNLLSGVAKLGLGLPGEALATLPGQVIVVVTTLVLSVPTVAVCRRLLDAIDARLVRTTRR